MKENRTKFAVRARRFACVAVLLPCAIDSAAQAEPCSDQASQPALFSLSACDADNATFEAADILADQSLAGFGDAKKPSTSRPWIASNSANVPLALTSADGGVSARASLETLRDFNSRAATLSLEPQYGSSSVGTANLQLPKAPASRSVPVDIWSSVNVQGYDQQRSGFGDAGTDETARASAGVDYRLSKGAKIGISAERGDTRGATSASNVQQDGKMAAYVTLQAAPAISIDARSEWQAGNAAFAEATGVSEKNSVSVAPRIDHTFALEDGNTLQPFISYKTVYDLSEKPISGTSPEAALSQSAAAGVTFAKPDSYSFSVSTDVDGLNSATTPSVNGKFELKLPIE